MAIDVPGPEAGAFPQEVVVPPETERVRPFSMVYVDSSDPRAEDARQVERETLGQFYKNSPDRLHEEYDRYEPASRFLIVYDTEKAEVSGAMRLIFNSQEGFKSLNDLADPEAWNLDVESVIEHNLNGFQPEHTLDVATIGVRKGWRGGAAETALALYYGLCQVSFDSDAKHWVTVLDEHALKRVQLMGKPFYTYEGVGSMPYIDSQVSWPMWADFRDEFVPRLREEYPPIHDFVARGQGLGQTIDLGNLEGLGKPNIDSLVDPTSRYLPSEAT